MKTMSEKKHQLGKSLQKYVVHIFLEKHKSENYTDVFIDLNAFFGDNNANMSIKIHFYFSHLDCFPENLEDVGRQ